MSDEDEVWNDNGFIHKRIDFTDDMLLARAWEIADQAHAGQKDKAGADYIIHVEKVADMVEMVDEKIVAALHDVVEDGEGWTLDRLRAEGFPDHVVEAVDAMTRREGESYHDFICRARANPLARVVKIADLTHNMDLSRIPTPNMDDYDRIEKYRQAMTLLEWVTP